MEILLQEYWSGLSCPPPGDLPDPGIEPRSSTLQAEFLVPEPPGKPLETLNMSNVRFQDKGSYSHLTPFHPTVNVIFTGGTKISNHQNTIIITDNIFLNLICQITSLQHSACELSTSQQKPGL